MKESYLRANTPKQFPMSMVASNKGHLAGHALRHQIIRKILESTMNIHIWGRGINYIYRDPRVKGSTENKPEMFAPYQFTIAVENASYPWWVTEKYYDPLLVNCIPLYWGAKNVSSVFGSNSHIELSGDLNNIMAIIKDVYSNHNQKYALPQARNLLLGERNYAHFLWRWFNNDRSI